MHCTTSLSYKNNPTRSFRNHSRYKTILKVLFRTKWAARGLGASQRLRRTPRRTPRRTQAQHRHTVSLKPWKQPIRRLDGSAQQWFPSIKGPHESDMVSLWLDYSLSTHSSRVRWLHLPMEYLLCCIHHNTSWKWYLYGQVGLRLEFYLTTSYLK